MTAKGSVIAPMKRWRCDAEVMSVLLHETRVTMEMINRLLFETIQYQMP